MKILISGVTGQIGSYLAELLLSKGHEVHGIVRRSSTFPDERIVHLYPKEHLPLGYGIGLCTHYGDLLDSNRLIDLLYEIRPDEVYNLGAQSDVRVSFDEPIYTSNVDALGTARLLEAIRKSKLRCKFYQASSSEMFGNSPAPQNENTPFMPRSPYSCSKVYSHHMTLNYRDGYGMFACAGILFNTESERRLEVGVTRKITKAVARIVKGEQSKLYLGNLDAKRDWGYAKEYVEAIHLIMQYERPDVFVIGTGESHSVKEFLDEAFGLVNLDWHDYVEISPVYFRPTEVDNLRADASKAQKLLGWEPKIKFKELVKLMIEHDMKG